MTVKKKPLKYSSLSTDRITIFLEYLSKHFEENGEIKDVKFLFSDVNGTYKGYCHKVGTN